MGYYTTYSGGIISNNLEDFDRKPEIAQTLAQFPYFKNWRYSSLDEIESIEDVVSGEEHKWYDHEKDMIELSKLYPDILFYLHGEGEDREDIWHSYFKNGKCITYYAEIIFPDEPSTSRLREIFSEED